MIITEYNCILYTFVFTNLQIKKIHLEILKKVRKLENIYNY